jgi:hypothetical protein
MATPKVVRLTHKLLDEYTYYSVLSAVKERARAEGHKELSRLLNGPLEEAAVVDDAEEPDDEDDDDEDDGDEDEDDTDDEDDSEK